MAITPRESHDKHEIHTHQHVVQFSESDASLIHSVDAFINDGLRAGESCIVVATQAHRDSLGQHLKAQGLDLATAQTVGSYIPLDAAATLSHFLVDGQPEQKKFIEVIGPIIERAARGQRHVRIFGEMVALLWAEGKHADALRLEDFWNELSETYFFRLLCAYPMRDFSGKAYEADFMRICQQHTQVMPAENYTQLSQAESLRALALLQQKARSLEIEVAAHKAAQERLRMLAAIVESSDDAILSKNMDGIVTSWNAAAEHMYGYSAEEMIGQSVTCIFPPDKHEEFEQIMESLRRGERVEHHKTKRVRKDGTVLTVSVTVSPVKDETGAIIGASDITRDITEQQQQEQRKDEFISMASHELKTPVTSLKGFLGLLRRLLAKQENERVLHYLNRMNAQIDKLTKLINDLLDISRMQNGQLVYRKESFSMDMLVREIVENVQETTRTHRLQIEGQTQAKVFGDRDRLGQVLVNLLTNAIKYSPNADRVIVYLAADEKQVLVGVQDFGIGITKEHHQKIFERFYQVSDSEEKTYAGLGIGLAICHEIVKRHEGHLWVESQKGAGATFHVSLPRMQEKEEPASED